jgi:HAD superfamily hydrolase (TIGR01509 family)
VTSSAQLPPIELVVFDLGRVLVRICDDWMQACESAGVKLELAQIDTAKLTAMRDAVHRVETNELTFDQFTEEVAKLLGATSAQIRNASSAFALGLYEGVEPLLNELHESGIATACLSNTNEQHWAFLADAKHPSYFPLAKLKHHFASHLIQARKPAPAIYEHLEKETGVSGPSILFFDDLQENIDGALKRGWTAIWINPEFNDPLSQIRSALARYRVLGT